MGKTMRWLGAAIAAVMVASTAANAAMPPKFAIACEAGRFGHGPSQAGARANLQGSAERGPQYRDTYEFDLEARTTKMKWADGKRVQTRTMTALTADAIEIYNYRLLTVESARRFDFNTMLNTSISHFMSADPDYAWAVTEQHCAITH